jgi:hypothetical protein
VKVTRGWPDMKIEDATFEDFKKSYDKVERLLKEFNKYRDDYRKEQGEKNGELCIDDVWIGDFFKEKKKENPEFEGFTDFECSIIDLLNKIKMKNYSPFFIIDENYKKRRRNKEILKQLTSKRDSKRIFEDIKLFFFYIRMCYEKGYKIKKDNFRQYFKEEYFNDNTLLDCVLENPFNVYSKEKREEERWKIIKLFKEYGIDYWKENEEDGQVSGPLGNSYQLIINENYFSIEDNQIKKPGVGNSEAKGDKNKSEGAFTGIQPYQKFNKNNSKVNSSGGKVDSSGGKVDSSGGFKKIPSSKMSKPSGKVELTPLLFKKALTSNTQKFSKMIISVIPPSPIVPLTNAPSPVQKHDIFPIALEAF